MPLERLLTMAGYGPSVELADVPDAVAVRPRLVLLALDAVGIGIVIAAFTGAQDPDVLFHLLWIVLCFQAFLFGGIVGGSRIAVAGAAVLGYAVLAEGESTGLGALLVDLDLEEWPLMLIIVTIVAVLAERAARARARYAALYQATRDRLVTAQEDERRLLAADLHDGVGQTLTALSLTLDAVAQRLAATDPDGISTHGSLARAQELCGIALEDTRRVALRLRPTRLQEVGLVGAIRQLASASGAAITVEAPERLVQPHLLPPDVETNVFRIVQEAVGNAMRHARAHTIVVTLRDADGRLQVDIVDDGAGFRVAQGRWQGLGLETMNERARAIGGHLSVVSLPSRGTRVRLRVPMAAGRVAGAGDPAVTAHATIP